MEQKNTIRRINTGFFRTLALLAFMAFLSIDVVAQDWQWIVREGGTSTESGRKVALDDAGNSFVAFRFFGTVKVGATTYTSSSFDVMLVKYDVSGIPIWARQIASASDEDLSSLAYDKHGGVYIAGVFAGATLDYGSGTLTNTASTKNDVYVLHYDASGAVTWTFQPKGAGNDNVGAVYSDGNSVVIAGNTFSNPIVIGGTSYGAPYYNAGWVCKIDNAGTITWARQFYGNYIDKISGVVLDKAGNTYIGGSLGSDPLTIDGKTVNRTSAYGKFDIYMAGFDGMGICSWLKSATAVGSDELTSLAIDGSDNLYFTGFFNGGAPNTLTMGGYSLANPLATEQFLVGSMDALGNMRWLKKAANDVQSGGQDLHTTGTELYISGYYKGGGIQFASTTANAGGSDAFALLMDSNGGMTWNDGWGGVNDEYATGIAAASCGAVVTGDFNSSALTLAGNTVKNASVGNTDVYTAKLSKKLAYTMPPAPSGCAQSVTLDAGAGYAAYQWVTGETTQTITATGSGTYSVKVFDNNGCYGTGSTDLSFIMANVIETDKAVCPGVPVSLHADSSGLTGKLILHATHAMNVQWADTLLTVPNGRYRIVVKGSWRTPLMGSYLLDGAYQYNPTPAPGVAIKAWTSPANSPMPFRVGGNPIRPANDVFQTTHTYEYFFNATSTKTIIDFVDGGALSNTGSLDLEIYQVNKPVTMAWSTGESTNTIVVKPAAATTYTLTVSDGTTTCTDQVKLDVLPTNTVTLSSSAGTDAQTTCINTPINTISYTTTGATGATVTDLPAGLSGSWAANKVTISGSPSAAGDFTYTITLTGGCGSVTTTGKIKVVLSNTIALSSAAGTDLQTTCINTAFTPITYNTTLATGATFSGLPTGVTGNWTANVVTISGTPTISGSFPYTVTLTGGCGNIKATGTLNVTADNGITLSSAAGTDAQTSCVNLPINTITYTTTGATGAIVTGLPTGVTYAWASNVLTISGTPTVTGSAPYLITLLGGCGSITKAGSLNITATNTVSLASATGTDAQSVCVNTAITPIQYNTTGATGATVTGLPTGVTSTWSANVLTISGTPTASGNVTYTVSLNGGCGTVSTTGTIGVRPVNTISLSSAVGSDAQTVCVNSAILPISFATTGATNATISGLPAGVTYVWASDVLTISGTPAEAGSFPYTITLTGGCGTVSKSATLTVNINTITLSSVPATEAQSICLNSAIAPISYTTTGATGINATGLPAGVSANWAANRITISGTATASGKFDYTITLTGGCGNVTRTGTINVISGNTITLTSAVGTDAQAICLNTPLTTVTYATTGATNATITTLPTGVSGKWLVNTFTISGTPTAAGSYPYTITLTGGCGNVTATGTLVVSASNTIQLTSAEGSNAQTTCQNSAIQPITYSTVGATGANVTGLPTGVTANWALNVLTISGTPATSGTANYTITLTGGCGSVTEKGSIRVNPIAPASVTIATAATTACAGSPVTFTATPVNPGTTPGYRWQVNFTDVFTGSTTFTTTNLKDGDLVCVVMNSNAQCVVGSPAESNIIRMQVNPVPSITASTGASNCGPGMLTLNATPSSGSVNWYAAATGGTAIATASSFTTPSIPSTTTYFAEASALGCTSPTRTAVVATINPIPAPSITAASGPELCIGSEVNYTTQSGMSAYSWTVPGVEGTDYVIKAGGLGATDNSVTINWLTTGGRRLEVNYTDAKGCVGQSAKSNLYVHALPYGTVSAPADLSLCKGDALTITATGGATYVWYRNGVADQSYTGASLSVKEEGTYTAQVVSAEGCKAPALGSATVTMKALPQPAFTVVPACAGSATEFINSTTYSGPGTLSFNWNLDDGGSAITTDASQVYTKGGSKRVILSALSSACPNAPVSTTALVTITSSRPARHLGPVDAVAGKPVTLQARTFGQNYSWSPASGLTDPNSDRTDAILNRDATYTVSIMDAGGCVTVDTVSVRVFPGSRIYVPTAFTPNGDGLNDRLYPVLAGYASLTFFRVYDRFGNLVHQTDKADKDHGWDGRFKGYDQPTGTFIWALRAIDENGTVVDKSGSFTLIR